MAGAGKAIGECRDISDAHAAPSALAKPAMTEMAD